MNGLHTKRCLLSLLCAALMLGPAVALETAGVKVSFADYSGPAALSVEKTGKHELRVGIDRRTERNPLKLQIELPITGPDAWPVVDVEVLDSATGQALPVRRGGIQWHKMLIVVPSEVGALVVHARERADRGAEVRPEKERTVRDPGSGVTATIARWHGGRRAALSIRFDDSHPTHLSTAIPILNEYGFRGTFMVNPGATPAGSRRRSALDDRRSQWEAVARRGNHEFANHTLHHRGAEDDASMEREVGGAAEAIWKLRPATQSKLAALNLGGGTEWVTTKPLRYYLDKYFLFDASANSTGMDDSYGNRVATFRRLLKAHIERGLWFRVHYHAIGEGQSSSEANLRGALDIAKQHQDKLWIAGMADIYKYQVQRRGAKLEIENSGQSRVTLRLLCSTSPRLYDQPLTLDVTVPQSWASEGVVIIGDDGKEMPFQTVPTSAGDVVLRFEAAPTDAEYAIRRK